MIVVDDFDRIDIEAIKGSYTITDLWGHSYGIEHITPFVGRNVLVLEGKDNERTNILLKIGLGNKHFEEGLYHAWTFFTTSSTDANIYSVLELKNKRGSRRYLITFTELISALMVLMTNSIYRFSPSTPEYAYCSTRPGTHEFFVPEGDYEVNVYISGTIGKDGSITHLTFLNPLVIVDHIAILKITENLPFNIALVNYNVYNYPLIAELYTPHDKLRILAKSTDTLNLKVAFKGKKYYDILTLDYTDTQFVLEWSVMGYETIIGFANAGTTGTNLLNFSISLR